MRHHCNDDDECWRLYCTVYICDHFEQTTHILLVCFFLCFHCSSLSTPPLNTIHKQNSVAKEMVHQAFCKNPKFAVYFNLDGWMLSNLTAGMGPVSSLSDAVTQVALMGVFRFISLFVLNDWWKTIRNFDSKRNEDKGD